MDTQGWTYLSLPNYGTLCRYLVRSDVWERLEATCSNCGFHAEDHNCDAIDCEDYVAAPFTDGGFTKTHAVLYGQMEWTGEVIHSATGQVVPLREWTEEESEDWMDNTDPFRDEGINETADDDLNDAIDASGNCFHAVG